MSTCGFESHQGPFRSLTFPPVLRDWVIKGLGMSSLVYATGHIKDPVPLIEKRRGLSPAGRFPPTFIHQVIIITGLNKLQLYTCSRPEDGLRCRQGVKPPLNSTQLKFQMTRELFCDLGRSRAMCTFPNILTARRLHCTSFHCTTSSPPVVQPTYAYIPTYAYYTVRKACIPNIMPNPQILFS